MCVICGCSHCSAQTADAVGTLDQAQGGASEGGSGQTYVLNNTKWGVDALGTPGGEITWSANLAGLLYNQSLFPDLTLADFEEALRQAFDAWSEVARISFRKVAPGEEADIQIMMSDQDIGNFTFGEPFGTVAVASSFFVNGPDDNGVAVMTDGVIYFDAAENWAPTGGTANTVSFLSVATHEIGHLLGLGHASGSTQVMNGTVSTDQLQAGDVAGVQAIYGAHAAGSNAAETHDFSAEGYAVVFQAMAGDDVVTGSTSGDRISGGAGDDLLFGGAGNDLLVDTSGSNQILGGDDQDLLIGGLGDLHAEGGTGGDTIIGGIGADLLIGGDGDDILRGDPQSGFLFGNDTLVAGTGNDLLQGGGGADTFVFNAGEGDNTIAAFAIDSDAVTLLGQDFMPGVDKIDLSSLQLANYQAVADAMITNSDDTIIDVQGTRITLLGVSAIDLSAEDFIL